MNRDQPSQHWQADTYADNARFVSDYGQSLLQWLNPQEGERILDLGCGDGALTQTLMQSGAEVVGVDGSADMVKAACALGVDARIGNGEALEFNAEFDAVFSNAALHWMRDSQAVIAGVYRALKPGGRFVAEFGGAGNVAIIRQAIDQACQSFGVNAREIWFSPTLETYRQQLQTGGFQVLQIETYARPTPLTTGIAGWLATFAHPLLAHLPAELEGQILAQAISLVQPQLTDAQGVVQADYVRLRFCAIKPGE